MNAKSPMLFLLAASVILSSCATSPPASDDTADDEGIVITAGPYDPVREDLDEAARWMEGRTELTVRGRKFNLDCTGIVLAAYYYAGIDLAKEFGSYTGNGVRRLYYYLDDKGLLYMNNLPGTGDIVFWDNTWDADDNGKADDTHTHVGMMVAMNRETGQGTYLHYNYSKGIVIENINLFDPDNPAANSPMRMRSLPKVDGYKYMSSQLVHELGRGYELPLDLEVN